MIKQEAGGLPAQAAEKALTPLTQTRGSPVSGPQLPSLNSVLHQASLTAGPGRVFKKKIQQLDYKTLSAHLVHYA